MLNRIAVLYSQLLATEASNANGGSSATVSCSITIGTISGDLNSNCNVVISNSCGAKDSSQYLLDLAFMKITRMEKLESVNLMPIYNSLRADCVAKAQLIQDITIHDINLGICRPKFPTFFNFINSGDATSNCVMNSLINLSTQSLNESNDITTVEDNVILSFVNNNYGYIITGMIVVGIVFVSYEFYKMGMNPRYVMYQKK